tara:strand:+ start:234 stop:383 length:150 start_codon:yes stop_codon:yes gene_type:complete
MSRIFNPFRGLGFEELELAYAYYSYCEDADAVDMVADAFCEQITLDINL